MKILANDGISSEGVEALEKGGFTVLTNNIPQGELVEEINNQGISGLLVRSATTVRQDLIDACPGLKLIGRGGVGMDNIDVDYARSKGLHVINTPGASSQSVAELVMANLFSLSRSIFHSNRVMPTNGNTEFKALKKKYAKGQELKGKTIGIVGFGRIGQSLASYCLGCGMTVIPIDRSVKSFNIPLNINGQDMDFNLESVSDFEATLPSLDYISLHVPKQANGNAVINQSEIDKMKSGVILINAARGGVVNEDALITGINSGKIRAAALDVFENEPSPRADLLAHEQIASTPHIGAATVEAQSRIGEELAEQIISLLK
ncbi:MAG: D-2-hydroxyacid dehydrogenase [Crocinitomicaceae bacterium]